MATSLSDKCSVEVKGGTQGRGNYLVIARLTKNGKWRYTNFPKSALLKLQDMIPLIDQYREEHNSSEVELLPKYVAAVSLFNGQTYVALLPKDDAGQKRIEQSINLNVSEWARFKETLPDILTQLSQPMEVKEKDKKPSKSPRQRQKQQVKLHPYYHWVRQQFGRSDKESEQIYLNKTQCEKDGQYQVPPEERGKCTVIVKAVLMEAPSVYAVAKDVYIALLLDSLLNKALYSGPGILSAIKDVEYREGPQGWLRHGKDGRCWIDDFYRGALEDLSRQTVRDHVCQTINMLDLENSDAIQAADMAMALTPQEEAKDTICREPLLFKMIKTLLEFLKEDIVEGKI